MQIRSLTKVDYDFIVSIIDRWWGGLASERAHPVFFYELGRHALVATEGDKIIGFLMGFVTSEEPKLGYIHLFGIEPEFRRRGVARALYEQFISAARNEGASKIKALAMVGNEDSIRFHGALDFNVEQVADYAGSGYPRLVFTKTLNS